jgi:hypothetical protein
VQALGSLGSALGGVASLAIGGGIAAVAGGFVAAGKAAADFEGVMSGVKAVSGATQGEMDGLSKLALQLGKDTSFSASEAAAGMEELVKGGLSIPDIMNGAAQATLDLAAAGGVSLPEAATIAANALAQFNLKGEDMAHVSDLIAGAANASAIDVGQFKLSLQSAGAVAATVGFSFDDLAQGIAIMGKAGIAGSDAGTSLKTMMLNLQPSTKAATAEMEKLGLLQSLETLFGSDAIRAGAVLAKEGATGFNEMATSMGKVSAKAVGLEKLNNAAGDFQALQGSLETAAITLGVAFLPAIRAVTQAATAAVNAAIPFLEAMGTKLTAALGPVLKILPDLGTAITQAVGFFTTGKGDIEKFRGVLNALIGSEGAQAVIDVFTRLSTFVSGTVIPMFKSFGTIIDKVMKGDLGGALDAAVKHIATFVPQVVEQLGKWAKAFIAWVAPMIPPLLKELGEMLDKAVLWIQLIGLPALVEKLTEWGKAFVAWVGPQIPVLLAEAGKLLAQLIEWVASVALPAIITKLVEWGKAFIEWVGPQIPPLLVELGKIYIAMQTWMITVALPAIITQLGKWALAFLNWVVTDVLPKLPGELAKINKAIIDFLTQAAIDFATEAGKTGVALLTGFMDELGKLPGRAWEAIAGDGPDSLKSRMYSGLKEAIYHAVEGVKKWIDDLIEPFRRAWNTIKDLLDKIRGGQKDVDSGTPPPTGGGGRPTISSIGPPVTIRPASITIYNTIDATSQNPQLVATAFGLTLGQAMEKQLVSGVR